MHAKVEKNHAHHQALFFPVTLCVNSWFFSAHMLMDHGRSAAASFCPSNDLRCMSLIDKNRRYGTEWVGRCFGGVCWNASLVNPRGSGARGPSAEVWHGTWGEAKYLLPIFNTVLGGTCMQTDGSRKVVVDGARRRLSGV